MTDYQINNKRIAKNTVFLYIRMLITMGVSLYTSRVILRVLGVEDFGVYNVVGGVVTMFAFMNAAMSSATQRYITFAIGESDKQRLKAVFSTSVQIHFIISFIVFVFAETFGLWYVLTKLVVPENREIAAMWVYQCSVLTSIIGIVSVPYTAVIVAHERMSAFAYMSILEVLFKLLIALCLIFIPIDKLTSYAVLGLVVQIIMRYVYLRYSVKHFDESKYHRVYDKQLFKEMISFAGWSFFGNFASVLSGQGVNMVLNMYFGPVVNAARGVAVQVQSAVHQFANNFQMAVNPQITKSYALGELEQMHTLMFRSARFSFFLLFILVLPILLETNFILTLWLKTIPQNAVIFTQIMLYTTLLNPFSSPLTIANQATGKIKTYQLIVGGTLMLVLPISYLLLEHGLPAFSVFIVSFIVETIAIFLRMYQLRGLINLPVTKYFKHIYIPVLLFVILSIIAPIFVKSMLCEGWVRFILVVITCIFSIAGTFFLVGLTKVERDFLIHKVESVIKGKG